MNRLFDFAFTDRRYRLRAYSLSGAIALICALIGRLALNWDEKVVLRMMACVLFSLIAICILYYVFVKKPSNLEANSPAIPTIWRTSVTLALLLLGFLTISRQPTIVSKVQASIVDFRLSNVDKTVERAFTIQSPEQADMELRKKFQKIQSIVDTSYRYQVDVDPNTLSKTEAGIRKSVKQKSLSPQTKQAGLVASAGLADLAALKVTEGNTETKAYYVFNTVLDISNTKIRFLGNHSAFLLGDYIIIRNSTVVFDGIDLKVGKPFMEAIALDSNSKVIVRNSIVENLDQTLDGITWINVQFQHSMVKVKGGPVTLINVSFKDCDLRWLPPSGSLGGPIGLELRQKINEANGQPITFAFEGYQDQSQKPQ
jgi:hypothetical protein